MSDTLAVMIASAPDSPACTKTHFAEALVAWYRANGRDLPWRKTKNAYAIWLSEIMLQQTQVDTVIPYYHRFLTTFPTIQDLATASADAVLKQWEGLGYYSRARNLHKAAQKIVTEHGGQFPTTLRDVEALPGIGKSTAGAILTFAYDQKHPILDGNVKRVLARIFNRHDDIMATSTVKQQWIDASTLMAPTSDPYSYNQGIMELGAIICTPKHPKCLVCPVQQHCDAFIHGTQSELPVKASKQPTPHFDIAVGVIRNAEGLILIQRRPEKGLLGGLWEFPGGKREPDEALEVTVSREIEEELGIQVQVGSKIAAVKHAYSHFKITLHAYWCSHLSGIPEPKAADAWQWIALKDIPEFAFPKANKVIIDKLLL